MSNDKLAEREELIQRLYDESQDNPDDDRYKAALLLEAEAKPAPAEPVAWGMPNSAITGSNRWMMLRERVPENDQYGGALWAPLYAAPAAPAPAVPLDLLTAINDAGEAFTKANAKTIPAQEWAMDLLADAIGRLRVAAVGLLAAPAAPAPADPLTLGDAFDRAAWAEWEAGQAPAAPANRDEATALIDTLLEQALGAEKAEQVRQLLAAASEVPAPTYVGCKSEYDQGWHEGRDALRLELALREKAILSDSDIDALMPPCSYPRGGAVAMWLRADVIATVRAALAAPAAPAPSDHVLVPLTVLEDASRAIGHFVSDEGWGAEDMQAMDNLDAYIAQHKARVGKGGAA